MSAVGFLYIVIGASAGALIRWMFSSKFNPLSEHLFIGTLLSNLIGAFLIGIVYEIFSQFSELSQELKILFLTGFLGSLTTFSTFSLEAVNFLQNNNLLWFALHVFLHVFGSILLTIVGILFTKTVLSFI